jgi:hypothetical protein
VQGDGKWAAEERQEFFQEPRGCRNRDHEEYHEPGDLGKAGAMGHQEGRVALEQIEQRLCQGE